MCSRENARYPLGMTGNFLQLSMRFVQTKAISYNSTQLYLETILYSIYSLFLRKVEQFYRDMYIDAGPKAEHTQIPYRHNEEKPVSF